MPYWDSLAWTLSANGPKSIRVHATVPILFLAFNIIIITWLTVSINCSPWLVFHLKCQYQCLHNIILIDLSVHLLPFLNKSDGSWACVVKSIACCMERMKFTKNTHRNKIYSILYIFTFLIDDTYIPSAPHT